MKLVWLTDGDKNTRLFHACVSERQRKSVIHRIKSQRGEWLDREEDISEEAVSFFHHLFSDQPGLSSSPVLDVIPKLISDQDNLDLERHPSLEEVKDVVFSLDPDSATGPDGFSGRFFTYAWEIVGKDVYDVVGSFFAGLELLRSITVTFIVLIPKVGSPQDFSQYRPISLCTFVNKIISKLLAKRLARVLPLLI
ncbi:uncharacterized protein LOC113774459 [Coffea eugenioides]|uniref:uncharacterized protein LOC113755314 n=1 Tax=Coffea eugenioides TaxID=49369 RepID=UPI000F6123F2|nr:uncharacterized protein LOC113755314 [Coffea eugenioides]XP_027156777.1 uncharacterized protein LOC113757909 [Coffea eugenioides]XP_027174791.1 uncharacterized protein LOC113774459 [Coffea eugenioides]